MTEKVEVTPEQLLALPLPEDNDAGAATVREYLTSLLLAAWRHADWYPFGNSGWQWDLLKPMAQAGFITIPLVEDCYIGDYKQSERERGEELVAAAISHMGDEPAPPPKLPPLEGQVTALTSLLSHMQLRLNFIESGADFDQPPQGQVTSDKQVWGWLLNVTPEERLRWIEGVTSRANEALRCFMHGHAAVIESQRARIQALEKRVTELGGELR